jgi:hypothetical protein
MMHVMKRLVDYLEAAEQTSSYTPWTSQLFQKMWVDVTRGTVSGENEIMQVTTDKYKGNEFTITTTKGGIRRVILLNYHGNMTVYRTQIYEFADGIAPSTLRLCLMDMQKIIDIDVERNTNHSLTITSCPESICNYFGVQAYLCIQADGHVFLEMGSLSTKYTPTQSPPNLHVITAFCIGTKCKLLGDIETITVSSTDDSISIAFTRVQS